MTNKNYILITLACVQFAHIMDSMIMMPLGKVFMDEFGISPQQFTFLVGAYPLGAFISNILGVFYLDKFDRKKALLVIFGGFLLGTFICAMSTNFVMLTTVRFVTGIFGGLNGALVLSIASDLFSYRERGKAMGAVMTGFSAASALGLPLGLLITYQLSWHYSFYFIASFGLPVFLFVLMKFPPITRHLTKAKERFLPIERLANILKDKNQVYGLLFGVILIFGHFLAIPFIAPYMEINIGFSETELILMYLIGGSLTAFSSPFFGKLVDRHGAIKVYSIILILSFIPTIWVTHMVSKSVFWALFATSLFFIFGSGRMIAPQAMISAVISAETRGSFMSFKAALQQLAIFLATILSGMIVKESSTKLLIHYRYLGYLSVGILLLTFLVAGRLKVAEGNE
ncbi:MAG: MFS transporter [Chitinophagales bacterium]